VSIRVLIAEDQSMISGALAALLQLEPDLEVVGCVADGRAALTALAACDPPVDVLLTDVEMPGMDGLELAERLCQQAAAPRIVVVTTFARPGYLQRALAAGVRGYLLKDSPPGDLAAAIRSVYQGAQVIAPALADAASAQVNPLTAREQDVLRLAVQGASSAEIAASLHLSRGTVRNYISEAISKLDAVNRVDAGRIASERGWL
jgi:two-component system response regulator DesR